MSAKTLLVSAMVLGLCAIVVGCSDNSDSTTGPEAPMLPPQNVIVTQSPMSHAVVSWDANGQANLVGYNVYRREIGNSAIAKLTGTPTVDTRYVDSTAERLAAYEYRVTSVSTSGSESGFTASIIQMQDPNSGGKIHPLY